MVLELAPRNQDRLLHILGNDGAFENEIKNLLPPSAVQNPLLRQLMSSVEDDFISSLDPPSRRQNSLLRQLVSNSQDDQNIALLSPIETDPLFRQNVPSEGLSFQSLMAAITSGGNEDGAQDSNPSMVQGGIDFSTAKVDENGALCVTREDVIETVIKDPVLECSHKEEEKCHLTYVTFYKPGQQEICEENFEKSCQITFKKEASIEIIRRCSKPLEKTCDGKGSMECRTEFETSCATRRVELTPGKFIGDTKCARIPVEICGQGCITREGEEECFEEEIDSLVDVPEEYCDIIPHKSCHHVTKLVPSLKPTQECSIVPKEICNMNFGQKKIVKKPLRTEWCLDRNMIEKTRDEGLLTL